MPSRGGGPTFWGWASAGGRSEPVARGQLPQRVRVRAVVDGVDARAVGLATLAQALRSPDPRMPRR